MSILDPGDCLEVMATLEAESVDAVVTDPPYGLEFMGKEWDKLRPGVTTNRGGSAPGRSTRADGKLAPVEYGTAKRRSTLVCDGCGKRDKFANAHGCEADWTRLYLDGEKNVAAANTRTMQEWHQAWATEALRVLKPSHYLLAFGGTRTWHRLACALEDAGFEIRDTLMWLYGSGFPKGKSCLKPAWEPIILARKPGPMRELGIEECRVASPPWKKQDRDNGHGFKSGKFMGAAGLGETTETNLLRESVSGRWPANLVLDEEAGAMLDGQTGTLTSGTRAEGVRPGLGFHGADGDGGPAIVGSSGGASRFFYCAKASRAERNDGCEGLSPKMLRWSSGEQSPGTFQSEGTNKYATNHHPTVKPVALMRWLVKLVARPGDVVLDPFMGSGTTGVACALEGREFVGIEREAEYVEIARRRIEAASAQLTLEVEV